MGDGQCVVLGHQMSLHEPTDRCSAGDLYNTYSASGSDGLNHLLHKVRPQQDHKPNGLARPLPAFA